jgi:tripeptide aminopeptidase
MINKARLVKHFAKLVAIDSPSFRERAMCDEIIAYLQAIGIRASEDDSAAKTGGTAGNLYACAEGTLNLPSLLFSAHMDTVEPSRGKKAVFKPDGRITSDGTTVLGADDLSGVAVILEALTTLKESGKAHRPVEVLFDTAEEAYCVGIQQFDFSRIRSKEAYVFDLSGPVGGAAYQAPSIISFQADFCGRAAHAAFSPEEGIHAIKAAVAATARIDCGRIGNATVNLGTISGGSADNVVPEHCTVTGEVRSFCDGDARAQLSEIESKFKKAEEEFGAIVNFRTKTLCLAYHVDPAGPVALRFKKACAESGLQPELCQTYGGSDNNHFATHGITGLVLASGMSNCHSCGEYTSADELEHAAKLALALILSKE